ncbi:MAG: ABC transporter ATP-binding protein [Thiotrichales bacterium]|nr:ABC transporter ATP-binding protein [Thiotrichales bacterium]
MSADRPVATAGSTIEVEALRHGHGSRDVLDIPAWRVDAGERCLITGPSGSGKSTLLHLLAGLATPRAGSVRVAGMDLAGLSPAARDRFRGRSIGLVLQSFHLLDTLSVLDNVRLARHLAGLPEDHARCREVLEGLGVAEFGSVRPSTLSHGQAQRVALARAVVNRPAVILADEPTSSLDDESCERVAALIETEAARQGATLVVATHDSRLRGRFERRLSLDGPESEQQP